MRKNDITIPKPMQLVLDDIGWLYGRDQRESGLPSRTGIPRKHVMEDYQIIEEVGKGLNQKINCMMVVGEWDREKLLATVPNSSKWGKNWEGSEYWDEAECARIIEYLQGTDYIEFGLHGLLHAMWADDGTFVGEGEAFFPEGMVRGKPKQLAPDHILRHHFDAFFEIFHKAGFKGPIRSYASPCGARDAFPTGRLTAILKDYGIQFWHNGSGPAQFRPFWTDLLRNDTLVQNGVICNTKDKSMGPWEVYDMDPETIPVLDFEQIGLNGGHWVNFLRWNPKRNLENLEGWIRYWNAYGDLFGVIISRDVAFAHYQKLYRHKAVIEEREGGVVIDLTRADEILPNCIKPDLYISVKKGTAPFTCEGGTITEYETRGEFINYQIKRGASSIIKLK